MIRRAVIIFCLISVYSCAFAQSGFTDYVTFIDSNITKSFLQTYYDNQARSINFSSRLNINHSINKLNFYIKNYYSSAITRLETKLFRDFDNVKAGIGYDINDRLNLSVNFLGFLYSDEKNIQLKGTSSGFYYLSARYDSEIKNSSFYSIMDAGFRNENQTGEYNRGPSLRGEFDLSGIDLNGYFIRNNTKAGYEKLDPRQSNYINTELQVDKSFSENLAFNSFDGNFSRTRRDYYFPADNITQQQYGVVNNIEQRTVSLVRVFDRFDYTISDKILFFLSLNPYYRNVIKENYYMPQVLFNPVIYDTEVQELSVAGDAGLNFDFNKLSMQLRVSYFERDEKHFLYNPGRINNFYVKEKEALEAARNNHSSRFTTGANFFYDISAKNRFEFIGSAAIFRYDTQSETNFDDRDELNYLVYLGHRYNNLRNLELRTSIDLNMYHTVYIFGQKSSNNNWNRVLRLTSSSYFNPSKKFRTLNTFSVLANYTVYDFEDLISEVNSYTFRQFNIKDSTIYNFTDRLALKIYAEAKLYERGELNWGGFSVRPDSYIEDKIINPEIYYYFSRNLAISGGYRFFDQKRFVYRDGERHFDNFLRTMGPVIRLRFDFNNYSLIEIIGSYDKYEFGTDTPSSENGNLFMNILWNF